MKEDFIEIKGHNYLRLGMNGIESSVKTLEQELSEYSLLPKDILADIIRGKSKVSVSHLYDGLDFAEDVKASALIDYDGYVANVFVDGFVSNIRLSDFGLSSENFGVSYDFWCNYCREHKVKVDWVNR